MSIRWKWLDVQKAGTLSRAVRGKRGQAFFRDLAQGLDALERPELQAFTFRSDDMSDAFGVVARIRMRSLDHFRKVFDLDPDSVDCESLSRALDISESLLQSLVFEIQQREDEPPGKLWHSIRSWAHSQISHDDGPSLVNLQPTSLAPREGKFVVLYSYQNGFPVIGLAARTGFFTGVQIEFSGEVHPMSHWDFWAYVPEPRCWESVARKRKMEEIQSSIERYRSSIAELEQMAATLEGDDDAG